MKEFFGWGGYQRQPEGAYSWQHLLFVTSLLALMFVLSITLGRKNRRATERVKNRPLLIAALLMDGLELFKIVFLCFRGQDPMNWIYNLPLFLCSIPLIAIPLAALAKGKLREASLDFVMIFGILAAVLGTYGAAQNYSAYPVLSFDNVVSGLTHCISGFASVYIFVAGLASMKRSNIHLTVLILTGFFVAAYVANRLVDYNYMFLMRGDGTPYDILFNLTGGSPVLYPLGVLALFLLYIGAFYYGYYLAARKKVEKGCP